jgi:hypothetical protein
LSPIVLASLEISIPLRKFVYGKLCFAQPGYIQYYKHFLILAVILFKALLRQPGETDLKLADIFSSGKLIYQRIVIIVSACDSFFRILIYLPTAIGMRLGIDVLYISHL